MTKAAKVAKVAKARSLWLLVSVAVVAGGQSLVSSTMLVVAVVGVGFGGVGVGIIVGIYSLLRAVVRRQVIVFDYPTFVFVSSSPLRPLWVVLSSLKSLYLRTLWFVDLSKAGERVSVRIERGDGYIVDPCISGCIVGARTGTVPISRRRFRRPRIPIPSPTNRPRLGLYYRAGARHGDTGCCCTSSYPLNPKRHPLGLDA